MRLETAKPKRKRKPNWNADMPSPRYSSYRQQVLDAQQAAQQIYNVLFYEGNIDAVLELLEKSFDIINRHYY
jgi:hypothetical protein